MSSNGETEESSANLEGDEQQTLITKCSRLETQMEALKEVAALRKNLLTLREKESKELIEKLKYFEELVSVEKRNGQELSKRVTAAEGECVTLMEKIGQDSFSLNEMKIEYEAKMEELGNKVEAAQKQCEVYAEENEQLRVRAQEDKSLETKKLEKELRLTLEKNRVLNFQMSMLNTLFTETEDKPLDLDRVRAIGDLVRESNQLPEALGETGDIRDASGNLPLRITELDFDGIIEKLDATEHNPISEIPGQESCYQSMEGNEGPVKVLSVSRTFIKLKDLILEKKSLKKEIDGLKNLNEKLFKTVDKQEKRLFNVTTELNKTWGHVTTLEAEQKSLHNSRSALRYELHEKRKLLDKIKSDLFLSHEKWTKVKQKNSDSQIEWNSIRAEFARRRLESMSRQSQESAFCEGTSSNESNSEIEITAEETEEEEEDSEKRKSLEDETFNDPMDEFVSELVEEIEDIEAAADEQEEEDDVEDDNEGDNPDVFVNRRAQRLRLLEEQCRLLYSKLKASSARNTDLANKLSNLHDHYGSPDPEQNLSSGEASTSGSPCTSTSAEPAVVVLPVTPDENSTAASVDPEPNAASEFVGLPPQSQSESFPSTSSHSQENSLVPEKQKKNEVVVGAESEVVPLPNASTSSTTTTPQDDLLSSNVSNEQNPKATKTEAKVEKPKIPIPPPLPPTTFTHLEDGSSRSSPDLHALGRLIIQQLPKRLEILKQENSVLIQEAIENKDSMREAKTELDSQKRMSVLLQDQIKDQNDTEAKLRDELNLLQQVIDRLNDELSLTFLSMDNLGREKEKVDHFLDLFIKDRQLTERRQDVKGIHSKKCYSCSLKFSLLRKKYHCKGCGEGLCRSCTTNSVAPNSRSQSLRVCQACSERKQKLDAISVQED